MSREIQKQSIVRRWLGSDPLFSLVTLWVLQLHASQRCLYVEAHLVNTLCGHKRVWLAPEVLNISPHCFPLWMARLRARFISKPLTKLITHHGKPACFQAVSYLRVCHVLTSSAHSLQNTALPSSLLLLSELSP